ncbi:MAG: hypothetical protein WCK89_12930 [bacterium]
MELNSTSRALLAGIGCAALLAHILACTSFSPDDNQVLYPVFHQPSSTVRIAVYDRTTGRSELVLPALPSDQTDTNRAPVLTRAQWLPDGKHILIASVAEIRGDSKLSLDLVPRGIKEPARHHTDIAMSDSTGGILYRLCVAGSKLVMGDEKKLTRVDFLTGQTTTHENTNKVILALGGDGNTITAIIEEGEKGGSVFGVLDPQTMAFSPMLTLTNNICKALKGTFPTFNPKERQAAVITDNEGKVQLQIVNAKGVTFSRSIECASTNTMIVGLGPWLDVGPRNDRAFTAYICQVADEKDAEYGVVEIPFNHEPLRWIALFRAGTPRDGDLLHAQASLSHDGKTVALATSYLYLENKSLTPEDCALFIVETGQPVPRITKVPIAPPQERRGF